MSTRNTIQCTLIKEAVADLKNHPTADIVYDAISEKHPSISKATVYRNLRKLSEMGELKKIESVDLADHYDHQCHDHYHIRCTCCNNVFDVEMEYINNLYSKITDNKGFLIESHDIVFKGVCPECKSKEF